MLRVEAEPLDLVEPGEGAVDVALGAQPRGSPAVGSEREVREDRRPAGGAATQKLVAERTQGIQHRQQLLDAERASLLHRR